MLILNISLGDGPIHITNNDTGEEMTVRRLNSKNKDVRLGFEAPDNHTILRDKVYLRNQKGEGND